MKSSYRIKRKNLAASATLGLVFLVVIVASGYLAGAYVLNVLPKIPTTGQAQVGQSPAPPPSSLGTAFWVGDVTPSIRGTDTLVSGTNYQCGGAMTCAWFYNRQTTQGFPTSGFINTGITGNGTFLLDVADNGFIYLEVDANDAGTLIQDPKRTLSTYGARVVDFAYINIDNDTPKEMVYKIDARSIRPSAGGSTAASLGFAIFVGNYQSPTYAYNKPTASPETGIGTAANQTRIVVEYTFTNTGRIFPINNLKLVINASESSYTIDSVKIPVYGRNGPATLDVSQSAFDRSISTFAVSTGATVGGNTKNVTWTYTRCTEINCLYTNDFGAIYSTSTTRIFAIEILITFRLNSGDIRFIQVGVEGLTDDESVATGRYAVRYFRA